MTLAPSLLTAVLAALSVAFGGHAAASPRPAIAHLETGDFREFDDADTLRGRLSTSRGHAYDGRRSVRATYCGGTGNGFARVIHRVRWPTGTSVWYGAAFYLPPSFRATVQGEVDLLRWDDYGRAGEDAVYGGVVIFGSDRRARLVRGTYGGDGDVLGASFSLPVGRWFWLEIHQRLSSRSGRSEVYLDGRRVSRSRGPTAYGTTIDRLRTGIVAIQAGRQTRPLSLWFDRVAFAGHRTGPRDRRSARALPRAERRGGPRTATVGRRCPR